MEYYLINNTCILNDKYYFVFIKIFTIFILLFPFYLLFLYILEKIQISKVELFINNKIKENINKRIKSMSSIIMG